MSESKEKLFINKTNVKKVVNGQGKRWSKDAEDTLNHIVLGIVRGAVRLSGQFKTVRSEEVYHALRSAGQQIHR